MVKSELECKRTKSGVITKIYGAQKGGAKKRGQHSPVYTNEELREWMLSQSIFHELYDRWVESNYDRWQRPSCDRLDNNKSYTVDNLRVVTWWENAHKYYEDIKNGIALKTCKAVLQYDRNGNFVAEYYSIKQASRVTGIMSSSISATCNGRYKTAFGFFWRFK